ncbi:sensor histidine kinase [Albidovulum aquaemixtae]|nr:PAS domain S-box protein [Defluviimonas aquaemixtae]
MVIAKPLDLDGARFALVLHRNVSAEKRHEIEATHAEQNAKNLAAIVATMPDAVVGLDLEGHITSWNEAAQKLYGYDRSEVIGRSVEFLFPPDSSKSVGDHIADIVSNGLRNFEVVRQTKTGQRRRIEITAAPIRSVSGEIIGVSNVNRDVTEQRRSEQRLRDVLDNLFAFVGVLNLEGTLIEVNRAPLEVAGLEVKDVIRKKFWDCHWWSYSPDTQTQLQDACNRALAGELVRYDVQVRVAGEQLIWIDFQLAPLRNEDGDIVNLIPSGIDISDRHAALKALKSSHDTFRSLVEHSPFGIYTVDADFRIAHVSDGARKVFANVHPLIGHDFADALRILWPEPFATEAIGRFRHTLTTGEPYRSPRTIERRSDIGETESYDWKIERITMPDGRPGVVCNFYDLSERQRYEEHVRFLMREVNHRSKNLLTVVTSMARQTARGSSPDEFVDRFSQRLLGLSASQDLIVQGNWGGVTAKDLIRSQLNHLAQEVRCRRVKIAGPDLMLTPGAAQGIGMALHELSTNALKYGSLSVPDGTVAIGWGASQGDKIFHISWREHDGPEVTPPEKTGFGRTVIERMAAISVGGEVELVYGPTGASWTLTAPLAQVVMSAEAELP